MVTATESPKLWVPGEDLRTAPTKPVYKANGDVEIMRPFDIAFEIAKLKEEDDAEQIAFDSFMRTGVWPIMGGAAAGAWLFQAGGRTRLLDGTFDLDTDTFKMGLWLSTSDIATSDTTFALTSNPHATANGYPAGGVAATVTLAGTTTVTVDETTNPVFTASGGSIVARFASLYEVAGDILSYFILDNTPADVTATDTNTLTITINASGVFTLA